MFWQLTVEVPVEVPVFPFCYDGCTREELFDNIMQRYGRRLLQKCITVHILRYVSCVLFGNRQYTNGIYCPFTVPCIV